MTTESGQAAEGAGQAAATATETTSIETLQNADVSLLVDWLKDDGLTFGINILAALAIFIVGRMIIGYVIRGLRAAMQRNGIDKTLETFIGGLVSWALMIVVIIAAIQQVGIQTTSFIAIFGAAGLAVGLAMQGSLSNFAAGVLIVLFRPYKVGDWVEAAGVSGAVEQVQILTTILKTGDNKQVIVPNSQIMNSIITNYSVNDTRRIDLVVGVSYDDDLDKVRRIIAEIVSADERIHDEPACQIVVAELADNSVNFYVRPWVDTPEYWAVRFDLVEAIKKRFDEESITFPFPQQDVWLHKVEET